MEKPYKLELIEGYLGMTLDEAARDLLFLRCLRAIGVIHWEGFSAAINLFQEKV